MSPTRQVWAVILSWDGLEDTRMCLRSLAAQTRPPDRILVVDNGSREPVAPALRSEFPSVSVLRNETNLGYAAGVNQGLTAALAGEADFLLTPNNDAVLEPDCLERLLEVLLAEPRAAAVSPKIFMADDPRRIYYRGGAFSPVLLKPRHADYRRPDPASAETASRDTAFFNACCALYRAEALRAVGGFDETYFAYFEDADWSLRAQALHWRLLIAPRARAVHADALSFRRHAGAAGKTPPRKWFLVTRNQLWLLRRHGRGWQKILGGAYWTVSRRLIAALQGLTGRGEKAETVREALRAGLGPLPAPRIPSFTSGGGA